MAAASQDSAAIQEAVGQVQTCFDTLNSVRNNMQSFAEEAASQWTGQSSQVFTRVMQAADEKLNKIGEVLNELGEKMGGAALQYQENEAENASQASAIESLLDGI